MSGRKSLLGRMLFATMVSLGFGFGVSANSFGAGSDPFVGSRTYTFRTADNIGDGLQVYTRSADATISTTDGVNYSLAFTSPDMMPLAMVREGDWLKLQSPQTFSSTSDMLEAAVISDGSGGAMILYTQNTAPGSLPDDRSISYSVWSDFAGPVTAADAAGQWEQVGYEHWNLLDGGDFFESTEVITVTSLGGNRICSYQPSRGVTTWTMVGNEMIRDDQLWHDGRLMTTQDHAFYAVIGVEDYDPTDISLGIGYVSRIPAPLDFNNDGKVNNKDFGGLAGSWKLADGDVGYDDRFDLSDNDNIDADDLAVFSDYWLDTISDHVLHIEMSTTYDFGDVSGVPVEYQFDASMQVDDTVVSGTILTPEGVVYPAVMEVDEGENWLGISERSPLLSGLADFTEGFYIFTVNYTNGATASTAVLYALEDGSAIPPVDQPLNATYPLNNAIDIPLTIDVQLTALSNPDWTYSIEWAPVIDDPLALSGVFEQLPYTTTTVGPVNLSPDTEYELNLTANYAIWSTNPDGISYVIDKDSERSIRFTTASEYPFSYSLDDFDDNIMGSIWTMMAPDEPDFWLDETNQQLEVRSTGLVDGGAVYVPNGWHLDTSQNFGFKIRYHNEVVSETWSELLFALGDPSDDILNNHLQFSVCSLDAWGYTGPHFYYELRQNGSQVDELYIPRSSNDGWIFISYDVVLDKVYFGIDGYGPANAVKTVTGLLQGGWAGKQIGPHIGGSSEYIEVLSGQAYWDDLILDYGDIITE